MTAFRDRLDALPLTLDQAGNADVSAIVTSLRASFGHPLIAVGSGGSLVTADLLARLAERLSGTVARSVTPLELVSRPTLASGQDLWLVSAEGTNPDILAALEAAIKAEPLRVVVLCNRAESPLVEAAGRAGAQLLIYPTEGQKDGFLATHTLMLSCILLLRAGAVIEGKADPTLSATSVAEIEHGLIASCADKLRDVLAARTLLVVYDPLVRDGAKLIETNLWEAALANVQAVDFRNFAHGRHLWLAKRGTEAGLLILKTQRTSTLWDEMQALVPQNVPCAILSFDADADSLIPQGLLAAMIVTDLAGNLAGLDAGKPGVSSFGREIYHLPGLRTLVGAGICPADRKQAAIAARMGQIIPIATCEMAELRFRHKVSNARFHALVLDYDGTVVATSRRRFPPDEIVTAGLLRFLSNGGRLGIATGRGDSVATDLRTFLPQAYWDRVTIGYYNGGLCLPLGSDIDRDGICADPRLDALDEAFRRSRFKNAVISIKNQCYQLCFTAAAGVMMASLCNMVREVSAVLGLTGLTYVASSHSIDVLIEGVSKLNVISALIDRHEIPELLALRIGDSGAFPGNDCALLASPFGLSVDFVSDDLDTCWNLLPSGVKGPRGLAAHLNQISVGLDDFVIDLS